MMTKLLHIDASTRGKRSVSRALSEEAANALKHNIRDLDVSHLDLAANPPGFVNTLIADATGLAPDQRTSAQTGALSDARTLAEQLLSADIVVLGTPIYNFGMPAVLKAWFDAVIRSGETFAMTEKGVEGLLGDTQFLAIIAAGGNYRTGAMFEGLDHLTPHLKTMLSWIGVETPHIVHAHPTTFEGEEGRTRALAEARDELADTIKLISTQ